MRGSVKSLPESTTFHSPSIKSVPTPKPKQGGHDREVDIREEVNTI